MGALGIPYLCHPDNRIQVWLHQLWGEILCKSAPRNGSFVCFLNRIAFLAANMLLRVGTPFPSVKNKMCASVQESWNVFEGMNSIS